MSLDIPDEPPRQYRGLAAALAGGSAWLIFGVIGVRTFAVGGWLHARLWIGLCVIVPAMLATWLLADPLRWRTVVTAAVMVVGCLLIPVASAGATPSTSRLAQIADGFHIPGKLVNEVRIGTGRCRPACSEIRRVAMVRGSSFAKVRSYVGTVMRAQGFEVREYGFARGAPARIDAVKAHLAVAFELRAADLDVTRIAETVVALGPAPAHSVG